MTKTLPFTVWFLGAAMLGAAQSPVPVIQNGQVATGIATTVDAAIRGVAPSSEPVWVAWREPMVDGGRQACSTWNDGATMVRGMVLDPQPGRDGRPQLTTTAGPTQLEAGTGVVMWLRIVDARVERLRTTSDDCPVDANGRTVHWLTGIAPTESLRYLASLMRPSTLTADTRRLAQSAITATAMHRDASADGGLDRLMAADADPDLHESAARALALFRGRHGFEEVSRAIAAEQEPERRRRLLNALAQSQEPAAEDLFLTLAHGDKNPSVRAEAVYDYAVRAGAAGIPQVMDIAAKDTSTDVQRRAVDGVARLPQHAGVPTLLTLARTSANVAIRKQAVNALSRSDDPRALAYLEEVVAGGPRAN